MKTTTKGLAVLLMSAAFVACKKEDPTPTVMKKEMFAYAFNNGQLIPDAAYEGKHDDQLTASMTVEELGEGTSKISVTLTNTVSGAMYHVHAHDVANPATTPNGTPYNESPNSQVFSQMMNGNGGQITLSQTVNFSFAHITSMYEGFLVVHDPLQASSTTAISTYLVVGSFARKQTTLTLARSSFMYDFNTGQLNPDFAYVGNHPTNLKGMLHLQSLANGGTRVSVELMNTLNGEHYHVHAHDIADPSTTPNGTPYDETPNGQVCSLHGDGNGGTLRLSQLSMLSLTDLTQNYQGFFVAHDPLQSLSTTNPSTYVLLGLFAR